MIVMILQARKQFVKAPTSKASPAVARRTATEETGEREARRLQYKMTSQPGQLTCRVPIIAVEVVMAIRKAQVEQEIVPSKGYGSTRLILISRAAMTPEFTQDMD